MSTLAANWQGLKQDVCKTLATRYQELLFDFSNLPLLDYGDITVEKAGKHKYNRVVPAGSYSRDIFGLVQPGFGQPKRRYRPIAVGMSRENGIVTVINNWYGDLELSEDALVESIYRRIEEMREFLKNPKAKGFINGHSLGAEIGGKATAKYGKDMIAKAVLFKAPNGLYKTAQNRGDFKFIKGLASWLHASKHPIIGKGIALGIGVHYSIPNMTIELLLDALGFIERDRPMTEYIEAALEHANDMPHITYVGCKEDTHVDDEEARTAYNLMARNNMQAGWKDMKNLHKHIRNKDTGPILNVVTPMIQELMAA